MNLFDLAAVLTLNKKDYDTGLAEAEQEATGFGDKLKKGLGTATKVAGAVTGAAVAAGAGIMKMASSSATAMDEIDKSSQKIGISTTAYQEWAHAMDLSGMSIDTMKNGMKSFRTAMSGVDEEGNATSEEFQKLGISLTDANGNMRDAEDVMNEAILKLSDMEDGVERATIAQKLFGRAGVEMGPLLNQGSEAIEAMKDEAHELGLVMSEDDVKAGAELNDSLTNLKKSFGAIITNVGGSLIPIVKRLADGLVKFMPKLMEMFDRVAPLFLDFADQILPFLLDLAETLLPTVFDLIDAVMPTLTMLVQSILPIVQTALQTINPLLNILTTLLQPVLDLINLIIKPLLDLVNWIFGKISDGITAISDALGEDGVMGVLGKVGDAFSTVFGGIADILLAPFEAIGNFFKGVWEVCGKIMDWIWDKVSGVFQDIKDFIDWINPFSDGDAAGFVSSKNASSAVAAGAVANYAGYKPTSSSPEKIDVSGTIRHEGVNDEGEFIDSINTTMDAFTNQMIIDSRMGYTGG